jgi:acyl-CoA thioester hydrolase
MNAPFSKATATVLPAWIDYNGHMNVGYYHVVFDIAAEPFFEWLGLTSEFRTKHASSTFALQSQLHYLREVKEGDKLRFESRLLDADTKRIHYYQEMFHAESGDLAATYESLSVHMDMNLRRSAPMPDELYQRMQGVLAEHKTLARPWQVGHVFGAKPPRAT